MSLLIDLVKKAQKKPIAKASGELTRLRVSICEKCPFMKDGFLVRSCGDFLAGGTVEYEGKQQELCGCNIDDKATYENDHCPLGKW